MKIRTITPFAALAAAAVLVWGCGPGPVSQDVPPPPPPPVVPPKVIAEAGIPVEPVNATPDAIEIASKRNFSVRSDPFALLASERAFDQAQASDRLLGAAGGFSTFFELPDETLDVPPSLEPKPAWRLAGVIIGDGVVAILDMGNGRVIDIRPGTRIPDSEWTVVAIDGERAVLRRDPRSPRLPKEIVIDLSPELPQGGDPGGGGGGEAGGPGTTGGGGGGGAMTPN